MSSFIQWTQLGTDYYITLSADYVDMARAVSGLAHYRVTGQTQTMDVDVLRFNGRRVLHVNVPQNALPNGTEVEFWLDVTLDDASTVRVPGGTTTLSVRIYP